MTMFQPSNYYHHHHVLEKVKSSDQVLTGVLVDVSGSMQDSLQINSKPTNEQLTRIQTIFNTIIKIAKRNTSVQDYHEIFALAFGLNAVKTCDLFALLEYVKTLGADCNTNNIGYEPLIRLLAKHGAPYTRKYIVKYLTNEEAGFLYNFFSKNIPDLKDIVDKLPNVCKSGAADTLKPAVDVGNIILNSFLPLKHLGLLDDPDERDAKIVREQVERAKSMMHNRIIEKLRTMSNPRRKPLKNAMNLLHEVGGTSPSSQQAPFTTQQLTKLVDSIKPYIYGNTPMCEALRSAINIFKSSKHNHKLLFLLSDGESTDGSPVQYVKEFDKILVFSCLLTSKNIQHPRRLYYQPDPQWTQAHKDMFELSSVIDNTHPSMSVLLEQGWELPSAGRSRLFIQANHPDVIDEFSNLVRHMAESQDALLNICGRVSLDIYINAGNSDFKPVEQVGGTCYANAVATVLHLAMRRIEGRKGGVPSFYKLRDDLVKEYGEIGAYTVNVLDKWTREYRLHYKEINELEARQAINARRPVVANFHLSDEQWKAFSAFYTKNEGKNILKKEDLTIKGPSGEISGHAVVLIKCDPEYLTFINSWGTTFADGGFFRVQNQAVLNLQFYDVYWTLNDLYSDEIQAFELKKKQTAEDFIRKLPSNIQNLLYKCPQCRQSSPASSFTGHLWEATCPKCYQTFKPIPLGLLVDSYSN